MVSSLYCIWLIVPYKYVTGREPGKAAETVLEALSQETCYIFRGSNNLVKGLFALHKIEKKAVRKKAWRMVLFGVQKRRSRIGIFFFYFSVKESGGVPQPTKNRGEKETGL